MVDQVRTTHARLEARNGALTNKEGSYGANTI